MSVGDPIVVDLRKTSSGSSIYFFIKYDDRVTLGIEVGDEVLVEINGDSFYRTVRNVGGNAAVTIKKDIKDDLELKQGQEIEVYIKRIKNKSVKQASKSIIFKDDEIKYLNNPSSIKSEVESRRIRKRLIRKGDKLLDYILQFKKSKVNLNWKKLEELDNEDNVGRKG